MKAKHPKSPKVSQLYKRQQLQVPAREKNFFYLVILAFTVIQIVTGILAHLQNSVISSETKAIRIVLRILFYFAFDLLVVLLFRSKQRKQVKISQAIETLIVVLVGISAIVGCVFYITDNDALLAIGQNKLQIDVYILGSESLLWFLLILCCIRKTMNVIIYIVFTIAGFSTLFFYAEEYLIGIKTLLQGIIAIILLVHYGKKKLESFLETWKLKATGVLYKNVLNSLPESIMVLTESGKVEFRNDYLVQMFEYDIKDGFGGFCSSFSPLKLRDCIEENKFKLFSVTHSFMEKYNMKKKGKEPNPAAEGLFKTRAAGVQSLEDLIKFFKENMDIWAHVSNHTLVYDTKYAHNIAQRTLSIEIKAFIILDGQEVQLALIFRDTTDRDRIVALESENEVYKNNIIASFSHELRTPLNSNMGLLERGMDRSDIAPDIKENLLEPALVSAKLLLHLIDSILDYSQLLNRTFQPKIKPFPIRQTIGKCLYLFEKQIKAKGLELEVNVQADDETIFYTDHDRLSQILANLLSNALKFTFEGKVRIEFVEDVDGCFKLSVIDTGIGMEELAQEKLRKNIITGKVIEPKISADSAGIGLGLFMSSIFCNFISSESSPGLHFKSTKNQGSEFYFIVKDFCPPTEPSGEILQKRKPEIVKTFRTCVSLYSEAEDNHAVRSVISNYRTQMFKNKLLEPEFFTKTSDHSSSPNPVMIVDDEIFNLLILENYCATVGLKTERAFNGKEAIEKIRKMKNGGLKLDIILIDVNMPIMDGYETTLTLRKMIKNKEIDDLIIVGVTAYVSRDKVDKCYEYGMNEVVNKPLSQADFVKIMKKYEII